MKKLMIVLVMVALLLTGCGQTGVSQEEYDKVVAERDSLSEKITELENKENEENESIKNVISSFENVEMYEELSFLELDKGNDKNLVIYCHCKILDDNLGDKFGQLGTVIESISKEDWFHYDYVFINAWSDYVGMLSSIETEVSNMDTRSYVWYGNDSSESNTGNVIQENENVEDIVYQDDNIIITYIGISGEENDYYVNFIIENLSDRTLTVQPRETSINGYMVDPLCSIEIASGKKAKDGMEIWLDDAKENPMSSVESIETKFHIFNDSDWNDRYDTDNVVIK